MTLVRVSASRIYDGKSDEPFAGHIVIDGERIREVVKAGPEGSNPDDGAVRAILSLVQVDAEHIVTPGFVDLHSHSDLSLVARPNAPSKLAQGVTTEVVGNCGFSAFPDPGYWIEPTNKYGVEFPVWGSAHAYLADLGARRLASNVATLVGAGAVRFAVMGGDGVGRASQAQIEAMRTLVSDSLGQGAVGVSTGFFYTPGCFATTEEIVSLLNVPDRLPDSFLYSAHLREESIGLLASIDEALEIAERASISLHVAHLKAKGRRSWGNIGYAIERIEKSATPVTVDVYPYEASMTRIDTLIPRVLTGFLFASPLTPGVRSAAIGAIELAAREREGDDVWGRIVLAHVPGHRELERLTVEAAAARLGVPPAQTVLDISLSSEGRAEIIHHCLSRQDVDDVIDLPYAAIASDGYALPVDAFGSLPHPRSFGTFPRFLRQYALETSRLTLAEAIRKITSLPAEIAGLSSVGRLESGRRADLVVLDPSNLRDVADFESPNLLPHGVAHIVVGGHVAQIREDRVVEPAGRVLTE